MKTLIKTTKILKTGLIISVMFMSSVITDTGKVSAQYGDDNDRAGAFGFSIGDKGYVIGGYAQYGGGTYSNHLWEYNPSTDSWTKKSNFGGDGRCYASTFVIGTQGYAGFGNSDGPVYDDFWEWNQSTDTWTQKSGYGAQRTHALGFSIGTKGYVALGQSGWGGNDFWEYNSATDTWTQITDFPGDVREGAIAFVIGTKAYVGTGYNTTTQSYYKDFWVWDQTTNKWTQLKDFPGTARSEAFAFTIGNKGYIGTGKYGDTKDYYLNDFWEYNPDTDTWTQKANTQGEYGGGKRYAAVGFAINGKGYMGTGDWFSACSDFWEYDPTTDTWTQKARVGSGGSVFINENSDQHYHLFVYPNPSDGNIFINYHTESNIRFILMDVAGRELTSFLLTPQNEQLNISLTGYSKGIYFYQVSSKDAIIEYGKILITN